MNLVRPSFAPRGVARRTDGRPPILASLTPGTALRVIWPDGIVVLKRARPVREFLMETGEFSQQGVLIVDLTGEPEARVFSLAILAGRWWRCETSRCLELLRHEREIAVGTEHFAGVIAPATEAKR